jgi:hypothetical protein
MSNITFPDAIDGYITCASEPMNGIRVKIELLADVQIGAKLMLSWQGFRDVDGTSPIQGTETSLIHYVKENDISNGVVMTIGNYFQHIKPIKHGSARASYTIDDVPYPFATVRIFLLNAAGQTCDEVTKTETGRV